jgi:transcriptional regulator with XRE-family HTH domain
MRDSRKHLGWSQQRAAAALRVSQSYLSMLETGERPLPDALLRSMVCVYKLSPASLPTPADPWSPGEADPQSLAEELAALGYPGFAYLRKGHPNRNPAEVFLSALARPHLEARVFEALPWLLLEYWEMDPVWLAAHARLCDLQNRMGFVVTLARKVEEKANSSGSARDAALEKLESVLRQSLLAKEDTVGQSDLSYAERTWLREHRCEEARQWNLLTAWRPELLRYAA